ncbi:MAG: acyl carrier protein [Robiginitalea sp.]|jgi:acyl carrier protein
MNKPDHYKELLEIITPYLPPDVNAASIEADSHLINDLNINSSHLVDVVLDVEDRYDIRMEDTDMQQMQTVSDALQIIRKKLGSA